MLAHLHDATMKKKLFEFARANPGYMIELYGYYKPKLALSQLAESLRTVPLAAWLVSLPTLLMAFVLLSGASINLTAMIAVAFIVWTSAQLPAIWAYPANHVVADRLWATFVLIAFLLLAVLVRGGEIISTVFARRQASRQLA